MRLLLDSSGQEVVCALGDAQGVVVEERFPTGTPESRDIGLLAGRVLGELLVGELDSIVVGTGPGSFIGTRVAISYANGLAANGGTQLVGVNTLAAIAAVYGTGSSCVIRDARRGEVYLYSVQGNSPLTGLVAIADLEPQLSKLGNGLAVIEEPVDGQQRLRETYRAIAGACSRAGVEVVACPGVPAEGLRRTGAGVDAVDYIEPEYLRSFL